MKADLERRQRSFNTNATDAWHIIQSTNWTNMPIYTISRLAAGQYPASRTGASLVNRRKKLGLSWFGHVCCHDTLPKIISVDGRRHRGRPRKSWKENIKEWTGQSMSSLLRVAEDRRRWAAITAEASVGVGYSLPQLRLGVTGFD